MDAAPHTTVVEADLDAQAANADTTTIAGEASEDATVTAVELIPSAAIVGDATNNRTFTVKNRGQDGSGNTTVATLALGAGVNPAAGDGRAFALSGTPANLNVSAGDVLDVEETHGGTGLANPGGKVRITLARR